MTGRSGKLFKAHFKPLRPVLTSPARITASASTAGGVKGKSQMQTAKDVKAHGVLVSRPPLLRAKSVHF